MRGDADKDQKCGKGRKGGGGWAAKMIASVVLGGIKTP